MKLNLNLPSGILFLYFLGGATASLPASFIFKANYEAEAGAIFQLLGGIFLLVAALFLWINIGQSKESKVEDVKQWDIVKILFVISVVSIVVMIILGETVRF